MYKLFKKTITILILAVTITILSNTNINNNVVNAKDYNNISEFIHGNAEINNASNIYIGENNVVSSHINGYFVFKALDDSEYTFEFSDINVKSNDRIKQFSIYLYTLNNENDIESLSINYNDIEYDKATLISSDGKQMYKGLANSLQDYTTKMENLGHKILFTDGFKTIIKLKQGQEIYIKQVCVNNTGKLKININTI